MILGLYDIGLYDNRILGLDVFSLCDLEVLLSFSPDSI